MAALSQNLTPAPTITLFAGIPQGSNNIFPRARVKFEDRTAITAKLTANTNTVKYTLSLPANYAYRLDQASLEIGIGSATTADNFEVLGSAFLEFGVGVANMAMLFQSQGVVSNTSVAGQSMIWTVPEPFGEVFFNQEGLAPTVTVRVFDNTSGAATDAQNARFYWTFLQYDIQQVLDVAVNAPLPVSIV